MAYEKRVCVLKQLKKGFSADGGTLSGAVYCERLGAELTVTPRILGLSPLREGKYVLVIGAEKKVLCLELKGSESLKVADAPSVKEGFAALVCFVRGEAEPIAFGACGSASADHRPLLAALSESGSGRKHPLPTPMPPVQTPAAPSPNVPLAPGVPLPGQEEQPPFREQATAYDDEAIAADDYFAPSQAHVDEAGEASDEGKTAAQTGGGDPQKNADYLDPRGSLTYYKEVREKLEAVMKHYPPDTRLKGAFPHSEWVRSEGALLGIVYEEGIPRYLCVAVEGETPPEDVKENCVFVPTTPFAQNEGFWVVFQDADTGAYVKVYDA